MTKASARKRAEALALLRAALALAALQLLRALAEWAARPWLGERGAQAAAMAALLAVGLALLRGRIRALLPARATSWLRARRPRCTRPRRPTTWRARPRSQTCSTGAS